jgi:arylsulfatase A-like enzyme
VTFAPLGPEWARDPDELRKLPRYQRIEGISDPVFYKRRYAEAVEFADQQVGALLKALRAQGRYDNALVVLTADHGESFTEREVWFDHGNHASVEQLHVPLVVKWPGNLRAGERQHQLVGLVDVAPTVLAHLNLPALTESDGISLDQARQYIFGESSHCKKERSATCRPRGIAGKEFSVRSAEHALTRVSGEPQSVFSAFDRVADPGEFAPLELEPPALAGLRERLIREFSRRGGARESQRLTPLDNAEGEAEREALRELGYIE